MRYFTDGAGHVARVDTKSRLGDDEFSQVTAEAYNVERRDWVPARGLIAEIRFGGDWRACSAKIARALTTKSQRRYDSRGHRWQPNPGDVRENVAVASCD